MPGAATIVGAVIAFAGTIIQTGVAAGLAVNSEEAAAAGSVQAMKQQYGAGVSTMVTIGNGLGGPMNLRDFGDNSGHIWTYPYPTVIGADEIGCFLHVHPTAAAYGSIGAVQYYMTPPSDDAEPPTAATTNPYIFAWSTPYTGTNSILIVDNTALTASYDAIWTQLTSAGQIATISNSNGFNASGSIGQSSTPLAQYIVTYATAKAGGHK